MSELNEEEVKYSPKLLVLGDGFIGKSDIIYRILHDEFPELDYNTFGVDIKTKLMKIGNDVVKIIFYDSCGSIYFRDYPKIYYKKVNGYLLIYDITSRKSFDELEYWLNNFKYNNIMYNEIICLIGNKTDLEEKREITYEEGRKFAEDNCFYFCEVSAKNGDGIDIMIKNVVEECIEKMKYDMEKKGKNKNININKNINNSKAFNIIRENREYEKCACSK